MLTSGGIYGRLSSKATEVEINLKNPDPVLRSSRRSVGVLGARRKIVRTGVVRERYDQKVKPPKCTPFMRTDVRNPDQDA